MIDVKEEGMDHKIKKQHTECIYHIPSVKFRIEQIDSTAKIMCQIV